MGQIKFVGAIFMTAIFAVAIISFLVGFGSDNNAAVRIDQDDEEGIYELGSDVSSDLDTFKDTSDSSAESYAEMTIESGDETVGSGGIFKSFTGPFNSVKNILSVGTSTIFGDEQGTSGFGIILTSISAFFVFVLIMYSWKTWKGGSPD